MEAVNMCHDNINMIYQMLHWKNPEDIQHYGIELAKKLTDLTPLILPIYGRSQSIWDNCAKALSELSDDRLEKYLPLLLEWLQDLNWPGALTILERLMVFSGQKLKNPFIKQVEYAISLNNEEGFRWLDYLSELLNNQKLKELLPIKTLEIIQKHYHNWGWWYNE